MTDPTLLLSFFGSALLYSSVGHGGGSAYLAVMSLYGLDPHVMKPTALTLNILVSIITVQRFSKHGDNPELKPIPLLCGSIPMAFLGGHVDLPGLYRLLVGIILALAGLRLMIRPTGVAGAGEATPLSTGKWFLLGAIIGFGSGATGTGGGIFLSAFLLWHGNRDSRAVARLSGLFILCNSVAGLIGAKDLWVNLPPSWPLWGAACIAGGLLGAHLGSRKLNSALLNRLLAVVLWIAAAKLMFLSARGF